MKGVKLRGCDDFCQFFHVHGLDVNNICESLSKEGLFTYTIKEDACSLKLWSLILRFHRLIRRSSAEMYVS